MSDSTKFFIAITGFLLVYLAACPAVPEHRSGLAGHRRVQQKHDVRTRRYEVINKMDFRRQVNRKNTIAPRMDGYAPWRVKNPEHLWYLRPTSPGPNIFWNRTKHRCDYMRIVCMRAYITGTVCGRTMEYIYRTFPSYCVLDFHNCVTELDTWAIAYMGHCTEVPMDKELYADMTYDQMSNNSRLRQMYIANLGDETNFESFITFSDDSKEAISTTTLQTAVYNYTDNEGQPITVSPGVFATYVEIVTVPMVNVTDDNGEVVTDFYGDWVTMTAPTNATTRK